MEHGIVADGRGGGTDVVQSDVLLGRGSLCERSGGVGLLCCVIWAGFLRSAQSVHHLAVLLLVDLVVLGNEVGREVTFDLGLEKTGIGVSSAASLDWCLRKRRLSSR